MEEFHFRKALDRLMNVLYRPSLQQVEVRCPVSRRFYAHVTPGFL
jgi:hypothetical protein